MWRLIFLDILDPAEMLQNIINPLRPRDTWRDEETSPSKEYLERRRDNQPSREYLERRRALRPRDTWRDRETTVSGLPGGTERQPSQGYLERRRDNRPRDTWRNGETTVPGITGETIEDSRISGWYLWKAGSGTIMKDIEAFVDVNVTFIGEWS